MTPPPRLSYDIRAIVKSQPKATSACGRFQEWLAYYRELPETEKDRLHRLAPESVADGHRQYLWEKQASDFGDQNRYDPCENGFPALPEDPAYDLYRQVVRLRYVTANEAHVALGAESLNRWDPSPEDRSLALRGIEAAQPQAIETFENLLKCAQMNPSPFVAKALNERKAQLDEAAHCAADPSCVAQQKRERLTALREVMCQDVGQRQDAQGNIREEWRYAHQAGVVDLQNLSDNRTLLEMADEHLQEGQAEWKHLTGKAFTPRRDCGTDAR